MPTTMKRVAFQELQDLQDSQTGLNYRKISSSKSPLKSILKSCRTPQLASQLPSQRSETDLLHDIYSSSIDFSQYDNLDSVLDTACSALAENIQGSHLCIYASLNTALRCKETNISTQFLTERANPLLLYAKRDLQLFEASSNKLDLRIVVQILKVADYLFFSEDIAIILDFELVKWFLLRGLDVMENNDSSKSVTAAYLHIFNYQRLPRSLSNDMALRLLKAITTRQPKFTSVGISSEYISVYRLLVQTNPSMMLAQVDKWLPTIIKSLVDPSSLVRHRALQAAQDVTSRFPANKTIGKSAIQLLESPESEKKRLVLEGEPETCHHQLLHLYTTTEDGSSLLNGDDRQQSSTVSSTPTRLPYIVIFTKCLTDLLSSHGEGKTVMTILSSIILMIQTWGNSVDERIEKWQHIGKLLEVCKLGFNSPYLSTKTATISSWNTIIYIWTAQAFSQYPDQSGKSASNVLSRNIIFLLHPFNKLIQESRPVIAKSLLSIFYSLLNVCMRAPSLSLQDKQWDITWELVLKPILIRILESPHLEIRNEAVRILTHVIDVRSPSPKTSSPRARLLNNGVVSLSEIPSFSGKWIKTKSSEVLSLLLMMMEKRCSHELCDKAWNAFLRSAKLVVQREIYTSQETMTQVTAICNFIYACCESKCAAYSNIAYYIHTSIDSIGLLPFSEESVQLDSSNKLTFNPQKGIKKLNNKIDRSAPVVFLWQWLFSTQIDSYMFEVLADEFLKFLSNRFSTRNKMLNFIAIVRETSEPHYRLWCILVKHMRAQFDVALQNGRAIGEFDLEDVYMILKDIFSLLGEDERSSWSELFDLSLQESAKHSDPKIADSFIDRLINDAMSANHGLDFYRRFAINVLQTRAKIVSKNLCFSEKLMDSLQLSSDSAIFQSLVDYLSSSSVTVDAKLSFLRPTLRWLSNNLIATSLDIASYLELQNKLIQVSDMVVSCKSDLLSVWNPVMVTGLNLYSGEIFTTILKLWNTYFTRKGVFYGPFSQDLIDIVNYIKREVRVKLKIPKQFPLVATRTSSRLGSRSSKSPVVPRQISSVNSPPETFDESSLESPIAKRTTGLENSNPVSISSIMLTPPGLEKNKKSTKLFEPTPSGDQSTGVKSLSLSELRSKQIFIDQAQEMKKDSLSLHSDEIHSSHDLEYSSQKDMGISSTNSDANDKDDTSFLISVSFAGTSDSHITEKLDYGEDSSGIQLHDTVSDTMQDKVPDTIVAVETTTFGPTENSESKILASRKLVIDETELVDTVRENYSEVLNTVESFESISSNESVGEVQETDHHSQKSSGVIDESESNVESLCNDSNEIETRPHEKFEEKGQDIDFENHNTHIDVQEGEEEEVSPIAKVSLVSIKEANIGTESIETSAKMVTTNETVINTNNNSQKSFCLSLERNRSDRSQSRSPIPTSFTSELQVNEHNAVQGLIPIRDMQKLDNVSDYAEGFRKRKRSPKVKSKKLLGELKRKKLDNVDDSRRSHLSDLQRVLSNMDWAANDSATKEDYFQMETSLMDALIKIRKRTIAKSVITNTGS